MHDSLTVGGGQSVGDLFGVCTARFPSGPLCSMARSVRPSTSSSTKKSDSDPSMRSYTRQIPGCSSWDNSRASRTKRALTLGPNPLSKRTLFTAT